MMNDASGAGMCYGAFAVLYCVLKELAYKKFTHKNWQHQKSYVIILKRYMVSLGEYKEESQFEYNKPCFLREERQGLFLRNSPAFFEDSDHEDVTDCNVTRW